jgi:HD-GYP domain-containing protein (c-di-GMP phosphodiesterase class II)
MRLSVKVVSLLTILRSAGKMTACWAKLATLQRGPGAGASRRVHPGRWNIMMLAPIWRVEPDAVLARAVVAYSGRRAQTLVEAGQTLSRTLITALTRASVDWVYVESDLGDGIAAGPLLSGREGDSCRDELGTIFDVGQHVDAKVSGRHVDHLMGMAAELLVATRARPDAPLAHDPTRTSDDPVSHALAVAMIGLAIGEMVLPTTDAPQESTAEGLTRLGAGLLLHDIGAVAMPPDVLRTTGRLNEMQREMVRWHPKAGEQIVSAAVAPGIRSVAAQHHEWVSGDGYPDGLRGHDIHINARIAAVADAYNALAARSLTVGRCPGDAALRIVRRWSGAAFDARIVEALEAVIAPFAPGCPVLLSDGTRGLVVANVSGSPQQPVVRVTHGQDAEPLTPAERTLAATADEILVVRALEHPTASTGDRPPARSESPRPPSLAMRGLEAGGLLDQAPTPAEASARAR